MKILVADDSLTSRHLISKELRQAGHAVILAEDGASSIAAAKETLPDLILMNRIMPGASGNQATYALMRIDATKHIPIVIYSISADDETDRVQALRSGAQLYVDECNLLATVALYASTNSHLPGYRR